MVKCGQNDPIVKKIYNWLSDHAQIMLMNGSTPVWRTECHIEKRVDLLCTEGRTRTNEKCFRLRSVGIA